MPMYCHVNWSQEPVMGGSGHGTASKCLSTCGWHFEGQLVSRVRDAVDRAGIVIADQQGAIMHVDHIHWSACAALALLVMSH